VAAARIERGWVVVMEALRWRPRAYRARDCMTSRAALRFALLGILKIDIRELFFTS
jgi:hypothetical protein